MDKLKEYATLALLVLGVLVGGATAWAYNRGDLEQAQTALQTARSENKGLRDQIEARDLADAVRERETASVERQAKENHAKLKTAAATDRRWSDDRVPPAVARVLLESAEAAATVGTSQPGAVPAER